MSWDDRAEASRHPSVPAQATLPAPRFDHLRALTGRAGLWERARVSTGPVEYGLRTDDNARALVVVSRQAASSGGLADLAATYLGFVLEARNETGEFRSRRSADGTWEDGVGSDDSHGRAWWALGSAAHSAPSEWMRRAGYDAFSTCTSFESTRLRANAYASLGAVEMLTADPEHAAARDLLERASGVIADATRTTIPWPEDRITYDNARLPDALMAAGAALGDRRLVANGLRLLEWLVDVETSGNHFSFAPVAGWSIGESRPGFVQAPIEAWAMADACHRAWVITDDAVWRVRACRAARWLFGLNDTGMALYDPDTGATCDALGPVTVDEGRGGESTLAGIASLQIAAACNPAPSRGVSPGPRRGLP